MVFLLLVWCGEEEFCVREIFTLSRVCECERSVKSSSPEPMMTWSSIVKWTETMSWSSEEEISHLCKQFFYVVVLGKKEWSDRWPRTRKINKSGHGKPTVEPASQVVEAFGVRKLGFTNSVEYNWKQNNQRESTVKLLQLLGIGIKVCFIWCVLQFSFNYLYISSLRFIYLFVLFLINRIFKSTTWRLTVIGRRTALFGGIKKYVCKL